MEKFKTAEEILEELPLTAIQKSHVLPSMQEYASQFGYSAEQMDKNAKSFAEWIRFKYYMNDNSTWCVYKSKGRENVTEVLFTTDQLYVEFLKENLIPSGNLQHKYDKLKKENGMLKSDYDKLEDRNRQLTDELKSWNKMRF